MSDETDRLADGALSMLETMLAGSVNSATDFGNTACSMMELTGALAAVRELRARRAAEATHKNAPGGDFREHLARVAHEECQVVTRDIGHFTPWKRLPENRRETWRVIVDAVFAAWRKWPAGGYIRDRIAKQNEQCDHQWVPAASRLFDVETCERCGGARYHIGQPPSASHENASAVEQICPMCEQPLPPGYPLLEVDGKQQPAPQDAEARLGALAVAWREAIAALREYRASHEHDHDKHVQLIEAREQARENFDAEMECQIEKHHNG